jgi:hypothetical protein
MANRASWKCPACGGENDAGCALCICGQRPPASVRLVQPKGSLWVAALPGLAVLALATGFTAYQFGQFREASAAVVPGGGAPAAPKLDCVETYAITLHTSEFYVREGGAGLVRRPKNAPPELSTVLRGMARNGCEKPLKNVRVRIRVKDDEGKRGDAWADVGTLAVGQGRPFERAWIGRVTSYEIVDIR